MHESTSLERRFASRLRELDVRGAGSHVLVGVSGGADSVVLLHLLRESARASGLRVTAAHLDHAMRDGSDADAQWVEALCADWGVELFRERLERAPRSEEEARDARYGFLRRTAARAGADLIATAHTADDQAETVLFRAVRGTGLRGLAGIRPRTPDGLLRPLLPFWRAEIVDHARRHGLSWLDDPSNAELRFARNRIRHRILPELEAEISPAARRNLVSLAALAAEAESALDRIARDACTRIVRTDGPDLVLARLPLQDYDSAIASRVVRSALRRLGSAPGRPGTRAALQFITHASSGREMRLPGGVRVAMEFGEARLSRAGETEPDEIAEIGSAGARASATLRLGGAAYRVEAGGPPQPATRADGWTVALDPATVTFPLRLRAWRPGDRIATAGGTKSLKKLFLEERIPRSRRPRLPVLVDATGRVVWVAGVTRRLVADPDDSERSFFIAILND